MKKFPRIFSGQLLLCLLCTAHAANAVTQNAKVVAGISIEQPLSLVPPEVVRVLASSGVNRELIEAGCKKYVGQQLPISVNGANTVWLVTTPGCGWGAHTGPMWLIERSPQRKRLIFNGSGIAFEVLKSEHNGYRDIATSDSSAGYYSEEHFKFDGAKYQKSASRFVDLSSPDACKLNPDIAACE